MAGAFVCAAAAAAAALLCQPMCRRPVPWPPQFCLLQMPSLPRRTRCASMLTWGAIPQAASVSVGGWATSMPRRFLPSLPTRMKVAEVPRTLDRCRLSWHSVPSTLAPHPAPKHCACIWYREC